MAACVGIDGRFPFLGCFPRLPAHFFERHPLTTKLLTLCQEAFARIAFH
jgi:hypothetical protein